MVNAKQKGSNFEREITKVLEDKIKNSTWKRIYGSGAIGTTLGIPSLMGDVEGRVDGIDRAFKVECKTGYAPRNGGETKMMKFEKAWIDKVMEEAKAEYGIPIVCGKFEGVRSGCKYFILMDVSTFSDLINEISSLNSDLNKVYKELEKYERPVT